jgi:sugar fermentation stimulation protein A
MNFDPPLISARFVRRYKRFFAEFVHADGPLVAHCPNTGAMTGCLPPGADGCLEPARNPARTLRYTWKLVRVGSTWVGIDTAVAVPLVRDAIAQGLLPELTGYERSYTEVRYGADGTSRIDLLLSRGGSLAPPQRGKARVLPVGDARVYVEVKSTTLVDGGVAMFPDAVTTRGQKHLRELMHVVASGQRAALVFCVQRDDCGAFRPADHVDPAYGRLLREAASSGVELYAVRVSCNPERIAPDARLPIVLPKLSP